MQLNACMVISLSSRELKCRTALVSFERSFPQQVMVATTCRLVDTRLPCCNTARVVGSQVADTPFNAEIAAMCFIKRQGYWLN